MSDDPQFSQILRPAVAQLPLYQRLARLKTQWRNCVESGNDEWKLRTAERIEALVKNHLPHGSGFDGGCTLKDYASEKLHIKTSFHHMDDFGSYDGWTDHTVTVKADLAFGFTLVISGPNRNDIKDYIYECFDHALRALGPEFPEADPK